jgi:anthranilate phosphoribosyltransferase
VTRVVELREGALEEYEFTPEQAGVEPAPDGAVGAGTPAANANVLRGVLDARRGTEHSLAVLNAGAAIYVAGRAASIEEGARRAEEAIDSGAAREVLDRWIERTGRAAA